MAEEVCSRTLQSCICNVHRLGEKVGAPAPQLDAFEACVDCWGGVVRGELRWPTLRGGRVIVNDELRIFCDVSPEVMAEASRKIQARPPIFPSACYWR